MANWISSSNNQFWSNLIILSVNSKIWPVSENVAGRRRPHRLRGERDVEGHRGLELRLLRRPRQGRRTPQAGPQEDHARLGQGVLPLLQRVSPHVIGWSDIVTVFIDNLWREIAVWYCRIIEYCDYQILWNFYLVLTKVPTGYAIWS